MSRKFTLPAAAMTVVCTVVVGASFAKDDSELEKHMKVVQSKFNLIKKATKTAASWKKEGKGTVVAAEELAKAGKESKKFKEPAERVKKPYEEYVKLMDEMIKASDAYAVLAAESGTTHAVAKEAFTNLNKTCGACHTIFKDE